MKGFSKILICMVFVSHRGGLMKRDVQKLLKSTLAKKHVCYVLITCDAPSKDGHMQVEMTYEGDATLAAYLLQGAQSFIDEQELDEEGAFCNKIQLMK